MDPLSVFGQLGEGVDLLLGQLEPLGRADASAEQVLEGSRRGGANRANCSRWVLPLNHSGIYLNLNSDSESLERELPKKAMVTGGGTGLGRGIAIQLASRGWDVAVVGRRAAELEETARLAAGPGEIREVVGDIGTVAGAEGSVADAIAALGGLDAFVSSAALGRSTPFLELDAAAWDAVFDVNLRGVALGAVGAAREMAASGGGRIVLVSSNDGFSTPPGSTQYSVSKAAVMALSRSMAVDLGPFGIQVNNVAPGWMRTGMTEGALESASEEWLRSISVNGKLIEVEEVAAYVVYLVTDAPAAITGATMVVDAGDSISVSLP
jgi:NAD(P)-dependent dehydrogenase (short-subunit alcohol dehydrogenase family)